MELTNEEKKRMLDELLDGLRPKSRDDFPPSITANEYATREGISRRLAYDRLENAVAEGKLKKERGVKIGTRPFCIYYIP